MKKLFFGLVLNLLLVINLQAATYYSSSLGYWCLARNGKSFCFRNIPNHTAEDVFIVDRQIILKSDALFLGTVIIEESGSLNILGNLQIKGKLEINFAGEINVAGGLLISETADVNVARYSMIHVDGGFKNAVDSENVLIDGVLEVMGSFENQGIIHGLGKIINPGECTSYPDAMTFNQPGCDGINVFNLPLTLLNFEAKPVKNTVLLTWQTAEANDVDFFMIERASGNKTFEAIGTIRDEDNKDGILSYSMVDDNPVNGNNIYRLVSVDNSGSIDYHQVLTINYTSETPSHLTIYPNPVTGSKINIAVGSVSEKEGSISIYDMQGKLALKFHVTSTNQLLEIENKFDPGFYVVYFESNNSIIKERLIVK